jgi:hypothetical protein
VGANPTRQSLQPEAIGAVMEVTKWLKPSMLKINHLLTIRSPNANYWRELDHVGPCDATEVDASFGRSYLSFVCQAGGSRCGCPTRSKKCWERTT